MVFLTDAVKTLSSPWEAIFPWDTSLSVFLSWRLSGWEPMESKVFTLKTWRRKCSPSNDWKQDCVLGRQEDPEHQVCFKSLLVLSAACIDFFPPRSFCCMKLWLYTLMHVAYIVWAETAESTGALISTLHNNHEECAMSSSIRNKS